MSVEAPPRRLADFLRSLRAVREFQRKPVPDDVAKRSPAVTPSS